MSAMKNEPTQQEMTTALKLRRVREHLGLSRPKFSELLDMPATTLKNYELAYRTAVPVSLIQRMYKHPKLATFISYLLDDNQPVEVLARRGACEA